MPIYKPSPPPLLASFTIRAPPVTRRVHGCPCRVGEKKRERGERVARAGNRERDPSTKRCHCDPLPFCPPTIVSPCSHVPAPAYRTAIAADHARTPSDALNRIPGIAPPPRLTARERNPLLVFSLFCVTTAPPRPSPRALHLSDAAARVLSRSRNLCSFRGEWSESRSRAGAPRHPFRGRENEWCGCFSFPLFLRVCCTRAFVARGRRRTRTRAPCLLGSRLC